MKDALLAEKALSVFIGCQQCDISCESTAILCGDMFFAGGITS